MINEIVQAWKEGSANLPKPQHTCKYCNKSFSKESTLLAHKCEPKRRAMQEKETGVQLGYQAYIRFYEISQGSAKFKTYQDFATSSFYTAFVKFGRHMVGIRAVNPKSFIEYVIKQNKKIDYWCREDLYLEYLHQYLKRESAQDALERALTEMQDYADENELASFNEYFSKCGSNRICYHITNGRVSPWVVYNSASGIQFLENLNQEQLTMVMPWIDPEHWQQRFKDYLADTEWLKQILKAAGL